MADGGAISACTAWMGVMRDSHIAEFEPGNGRKANFAFRGASLAYSGRTLEFNLGCLFLQGLLSIRIMSCGWSADSLTYPVDVLRISRGSWGMFPGWYRNAPKRVRIPRSSNHSWTDPKESTDCCGNPHIILWKHVDDPVEECRWSCDGSMLTMPWNPWDIKGVAHCSTWHIYLSTCTVTMDAERRRRIIIALYIFFVHRHFLVNAFPAEAIIYYSLSLEPKTRVSFL